MKKSNFLQVSLLMTLVFAFVFIFSSPAIFAESDKYEFAPTQDAKFYMMVTMGEKEKDVRRTLSDMVRMVPKDKQSCFQRLLAKHAKLLYLVGGEKETEILFSRCKDTLIMIAGFTLAVSREQMNLMRMSQIPDSLFNGLSNFTVNKAHASDQKPTAWVFVSEINVILWSPNTPKLIGKEVDDSDESEESESKSEESDGGSDASQTGVTLEDCETSSRGIC